MSRTIGLDVGTKTIGVAMSDTIGMIANPVVTLSRKSVVRDVQSICELVSARKVTTAVVGLPLELDGTEARSAKLARQIGAELRAQAAIPVLYVDERYSSVDAERQLISTHMSRAKRKKVIDQQAAVLILQSYLDGGMDATHDQEA